MADAHLGPALVFAVAALAMILVGIRPFRIDSWVWPVAGALILILLGRESVHDAFEAIVRQWNVLLFILGLMGISAAAHDSGAFTWLTAVALDRARGSRRHLFVLFFLAGALVTIVFSNDATAIVLTPLIYHAVRNDDGDVMPFLFGCIFVAGTASFGLPFSNPANILILPHPSLQAYLWNLGVPQIAVIAVNLLLFLFVFRTRLRGSYTMPEPIPLDGRGVRTLCVMFGVAVAYLVALALNWPIGPVAVAGAAVALVVARAHLHSALKRITPKTFALLAGLFALLDAVARAGFVRWALGGLGASMHFGTFAATTLAMVGAALFSNVFNNLPVAVASSYIVARPGWMHLAYPLIAGVDLGPNLTTSGSLATILWLSILRDRGVHVKLREFLGLGALVVPATLAVMILWFWIVR